MPEKDGSGRYHYSFQDLAALRTASEMLEAEISEKRVTRTLRRLREQLPAGRPLSAVRILVAGGRVIVKDRLSAWEPESGQTTLDFDVRAMTEAVVPHLEVCEQQRAFTADELYQNALDLELAGCSDEARDAYHEVLRRDPDLVAARINLGRLLHAAGQLAEAEGLYRAALERNPGNVLAAFNLGVVLEDQGKLDAAADAYEAALALDEEYADAHYNLSRLLEARGDARGALRHLNRFRRLIQNL